MRISILILGFKSLKDFLLSLLLTLYLPLLEPSMSSLSPKAVVPNIMMHILGTVPYFINENLYKIITLYSLCSYL